MTFFKIGFNVRDKSPRNYDGAIEKNKGLLVGIKEVKVDTNRGLAFGGIFTDVDVNKGLVISAGAGYAYKNNGVICNCLVATADYNYGLMVAPIIKLGRGWPGNGGNRGVLLGGWAMCDGGYSNGVTIAGLSHVTNGHAKGLSISFLSDVDESFKGVSIAVYNIARSFNGVRLGLFNICREGSKGVDIGLLNIRMDAPWYAKVIPLLAVRFSTNAKSLEFES